MTVQSPAHATEPSKDSARIQRNRFRCLFFLMLLLVIAISIASKRDDHEQEHEQPETQWLDFILQSGIALASFPRDVRIAENL